MLLVFASLLTLQRFQRLVFRFPSLEGCGEPDCECGAV